MSEKNEIAIYTTPEGKETFEVNLKKDTVWLSQKQMAGLFEKDVRTVNEHIKNIFKEGELEENSVIRKFRITAAQFRIWATNVLKNHLIKGYTINEKRMREDRAKLKEFQKTSRIMERLLQNKALDSTEATGLLKVIFDYQKALHLLDEYDFQKLEIKKITTLLRLHRSNISNF